ncbi:MAG: ABC transporter ATP-binding protein [Eggerthellaceae bacterium]|nr:ABC transporter ATP-binding protein [Eggerthellaceae bacterium]
MRLFRYFKGHGLALLLVLVLLVCQAFTDLMLPTLTSQIVDVGIQQAGVEHVAVDRMSDETHRFIEPLVPQADDALFAASYERDGDAWRLTDEGRANQAKLDEILAMPLALAHSKDRPEVSSFYQMMADYEAGRADRAQLLEAADAAKEPLGATSDEMVSQLGIAGARAEYEDLGYNLTDMQMGYLARTGAVMLALAALGAVFAIGVGFIAARTGAKIAFDLRQKLFSRVVSFGEEEIGRFSAASLITRGTNDIQLIQMVCMMLMRMVLYAPILGIGGIIMVMVVNASLGWIVVVAIVCVAAVLAVVFKLALPKFKIMQQLIDRVNLVAREMLTGLPVIRAFDRQPYEQERFDEASTRLMRTQLFTNRVMTFLMPAMMLIMNATSVAIVWFGGLGVDNGSIQTGDLIAFITYSMVIIMGFLMLGMISMMLPRAAVAAERVDEVIETEPRVHDAPKAQLVKLPADEAKGAKISFEDVSFAYEGSDKPTLDGLNFTVEPGQTLAIIGSTGSGKSTVLKLIERFFDVTAGQVLIDGVDVRDLSQHELRQQLGFVPQKAFLFTGTIATNVAYSDEAMSDAQMEEALSVAQALDFVNEEEDGADTAIAQGGTNVSGGQRQRLAIARALAARPRALLFDDSFSALDYKTDAQLRQALKQRLSGVTQVIVAQRVASIRDADVIVVLEEGRMVGRGTHDQLMETCDAYREIAYSQLSAEELEGGEAA